MSARGRRALIAALLLAFAVGAVLRLWNLPVQVMSDDELHAVRAALGNPISSILVTYQRVDNTIPLTAIYRFFLDRGMKLTEMTVRMPAVLSGLALLALAPWWVARRLGWGTAAVFAALLALSPGLVFYSRIARSYAPIVLLGFGALVAFEAWWRRPGWRWGAAYVLLAALAVWFHLGAAPFVVSPFLFAAGEILIRRDFRRLGKVIALGLATVAAFLAFLVPAWDTLAVLVKEKHGELRLTKRLALDVLELYAGSGQGWVAVVFWVLAVVGLVRLARWDRQLAAVSLTAVVGHVAGLLYLAPQGHEHALISFRYLLVGLPWVMLWVAAGVGVGVGPHPPAPSPASPPPSPGEGETATEWVRAGAAVAVVAILVMAGPFVDRRLWRNPFAHHNDYMTVMWPRPGLGPRQVPDFYRELAQADDGGAVLEYPWVPVWRVNRAFYLYQEIHGRDVVVAPARVLLADDRLAFRNMVPGTPDGFLASRARWLVVHRNLAQEEVRIPPISEVDPRHRHLFRTFGRRMVARLDQQWGKPDRMDRRVAVWDLERVRRGGSLSPGTGERAGERGDGIN